MVDHVAERKHGLTLRDFNVTSLTNIGPNSVSLNAVFVQSCFAESRLAECCCAAQGFVETEFGEHNKNGHRRSIRVSVKHNSDKLELTKRDSSNLRISETL